MLLCQEGFASRRRHASDLRASAGWGVTLRRLPSMDTAAPLILSSSCQWESCTPSISFTPDSLIILQNRNSFSITGMALVLAPKFAPHVVRRVGSHLPSKCLSICFLDSAALTKRIELSKPIQSRPCVTVGWSIQMVKSPTSELLWLDDETRLRKQDDKQLHWPVLGPMIPMEIARDCHNAGSCFLGVWRDGSMLEPPAFCAIFMM